MKAFNWLLYFKYFMENKLIQLIYCLLSYIWQTFNVYGSHDGSICDLKHYVNNSNEITLMIRVNCSILVWVCPDTTGCSVLSAIIVLFVCFWRDSPQWARASSFTRFLDHTQRRTTVGRTPLDEWSAVAETSTWQHTTHKKPCPRWDSNPQHQQASGRRPTP